MKTPEMLTYSSWIKTMESYVDIHGFSPDSWSQLSEEKACSGFMENVSKSTPDFFSRYRFIPKSVNIKYDKNGRILAMGTVSQNPPNNTLSTYPLNRVILAQIEASKKELTTLIVSESSLEIIFENSGYKLSDFTGPNGNWEPEPTVAVFRKSEHKSFPVQNTGETSTKAIRNGTSAPLEGTSYAQNGLLWILSGAILVIAVVVVWRLGSRKAHTWTKR